jgi:hypothetical protein
MIALRGARCNTAQRREHQPGRGGAGFVWCPSIAITAQNATLPEVLHANRVPHVHTARVRHGAASNSRERRGGTCWSAVRRGRAAAKTSSAETASTRPESDSSARRSNSSPQAEAHSEADASAARWRPSCPTPCSANAAPTAPACGPSSASWRPPALRSSGVPQRSLDVLLRALAKAMGGPLPPTPPTFASVATAPRFSPTSRGWLWPRAQAFRGGTSSFHAGLSFQPGSTRASLARGMNREGLPPARSGT